MAVEDGVEGLEFYKDSLRLLKLAYELTDTLPDYEKFNLCDQIRRSSSSVVLNEGEGYGRYHYLEKLRFFYIARGSLEETLSAFIACNVVGYCTVEKVNEARQLKERIEKNLNGYCRFIRNQKQGSQEYGNKYIRSDKDGGAPQIPGP